MPVKRYTLNGNSILSIEDFYDQLTAKLPLEDHFGHNLDALWDVLSTDMEGPFEIFWKEADVSRKAMKRDFEKVVQLLKDLEDDRGDFKFKLEK